MNLYQKYKFPQKKEKGQIIVIMALMFIGLVAIVGLAIDMGYMFVSYSRLRRAVDAAALAATSQFREGYTNENLIKEAHQFLDLNGITDTVDIKIETCETNPEIDASCASASPRKLVRVEVTQTVPMFFLAVLGFHSVPIRVDALSEAASVDLVLLIDKSTSMAQTNSGHEANPKDCNQPTSDTNGGSDLSEDATTNPLGLAYPGECHPFEEIKKAAILLVRRMFLAHDGNPGYDRVSIVTYDRFPKVELELSDNQTLVENTIRNLTVYEGEGKCPWPSNILASSWPDQTQLFEGPCRLHDINGNFEQMWCASLDLTGDPRGCMITNSGGGLKVAGNVLGAHYPTGFAGSIPPSRTTALWVVVWLTDGYTNAGFTNDGAQDPQTIAAGNSGQAFCPNDTWGPIAPNGNIRFCVDQDARPTISQLSATPPPGNAVFAARHSSGDTAHYDPDDYARDMIDFVTNPDTDTVRPGQGALLFTIGLGNQITFVNQNEIANGFPPLGQTLLQYGAEKGGGIYYAAPDAGQLDTIFLAIANKIATRLSR